MYLNTVVVVGDRFDPAMFKAEDFFDGSVDAGQMVVGPVARYSYHSNRCGFNSSPNRIDLTVRGDEIMPEELREAARALLEGLDSIRRAVTITGVGMNCDFSLPGQNGIALSNKMANLELIQAITRAPTPRATTVTTYQRGELQYTLRIEPEPQSQGQNLFAAINGHQTIGQTDPLMPTLNQYTAFREYVKKTQARINEHLV